MKIQLNINQLEEIIRIAKESKKYDSSLSNTIELEKQLSSPTHNGNDSVSVSIKSSYSECVGKTILNIHFTDQFRSFAKFCETSLT